MSKPDLIDIANASVYRGDTHVFDQFSLRIAQGERVAIAGPNGAGKTTLLKLLNRELYPVHDPQSHVRILGRTQWNVWELRRQIGIVSDDLAHRYPDRATGLDVVLSGFFASIGTHGLIADEVTERHRLLAENALADFGVAEYAGTPLAKMSTGQRRRCLLARAMVHEPQTLILDEPFAGLDLAASFDYLGRIRRMIAEGRSVLLVTHHLNEIPPEIDRVVLLSAGRIVADGPKSGVLTVANLEETYGTRLRLHQQDGYYFAYPPGR